MRRKVFSFCIQYGILLDADLKEYVQYKKKENVARLGR